MVISHEKKFLGRFENKSHAEKTRFLGGLQTPSSASLFVKNENFSFFVDKIFSKCRMTILKLQKDSPQSGEHSKYIETMSEVSRKNFQNHFQK